MSEETQGFGTPPWMLRRNTDPITSHIAAEENDSAVGEEQVFEAIKSFGEEGCISDQVLDYFGFEDQRDKAVPYSGITGRYIALERKFFIERRGDKRRGHRFEKLQLVMRALPEHERIRRQAALDEAMRQAATPENIALLLQWWNADEALRKAQEAANSLKTQVIERMFPGVVSGRYRVPLPADYELIASFLSRRTDLEIVQMSERRKRQLAEAALEENSVGPDALTDDTQWGDEHDAA